MSINLQVEEGFEEESSEAGSTKDQDESDSTRRLSSDKDTAQEQEEESGKLRSIKKKSIIVLSFLRHFSGFQQKWIHPLSLKIMIQLDELVKNLNNRL